MENAALSKEYVAEKLKGLLADESNDSPLKWAYWKAAAVQSYFDMNSIRPLGGGAYNKLEALESLLTESVLTYDDLRRPQWTLRPDVRRKALAQLIGEGHVLAALDANPDRPREALQETFENYLLGRKPAFDRRDIRQLQHTLQVAEWLEGIVEGVPSTEEVRRQLEMESLLAPFRFLVGDRFRGREEELKQLSAYVGVGVPNSLSGSIARAIDQIFSLKDKPPLVIYGPGGIGKSTLLARFILLYVELGETHRFPFVYLDFDRIALLAEEPVTLLLEALRQLSIQYPDSKVSLEKTRDKWTARLKSQGSGAHLAGSGHIPGDVRLGNRRLFLDEFAEEVHYLSPKEMPLLLILDTFEEVQCRSKVLVSEVLNFLNEIQKRVPRLRTVLAGRAPVESEGFAPINTPLAGFGAAAAQGFLSSHGVSDAALAAKVVKVIGGSPLTLTLAAELLRRDDARAENFDILAKLREEQIQAQLYRKILEHIRDEDVRRLAHPGLVLRRITPALIREVLAEPCRVDVPDEAAAHALFCKMAQDISLVVQAGGDVLTHRPELRLVMLGLIRDDSREQVDVIHRNAVSFYERYEDDISRAEELYHRLSLGLERSVLDARWRDGLDVYLAPSVHELPPQSQAFLAARMEVEVEDEVWGEAEQVDWDLYAARRARALLDLGRAEEALVVLRQRERLPASLLLVLEVEALLSLARFEEAQRLTDVALTQIAVAGDKEDFLRLALHSAELDARLRVRRDTGEIIARLMRLEELFGADVRLVPLGLQYLRQYRSTRDAQVIRRRVQAIVKQIPQAVLAQQPRLMHAVATLSESDEELTARSVDGDFARGEKSVDPAHEQTGLGLTMLHQLPPSPGDFTGRHEDLKELAAQLDAGATVVGIQGLGGVGKTALALKLAESLASRYPDAQFYIDLKGTSKYPLSVGQAFAHIIRAYHPTAKLPEAEDELAPLYRSVLNGQRALLLFDNAANRQQVEPLFPPASCLMIVTSRQSFVLAGQATKNLDTLPSLEACYLLLSIAPRIGEHADTIARLCGYLPLALRLAAGLLAERIDISVPDYVRRLSNAHGRRELVEASLELSYNLLSEEAQRLWRALAVFPGNFDAEASAAVWALELDPAQDALSKLVSNSLVEWNGSTRRYRLHNLVRLFADARLGEIERFSAQLLHAAHYLNVLQNADKLFIGGGEGLNTGLALFELEWENIQAGQQWARENSGEEKAALLCSKYPSAGTFLLDLRQHPRERLKWLEAALNAARRLKDRATEGRHLNSLGVAFQDMGDVRRAAEMYREALAVAQGVGDQRLEGSALGNMASASEALGDTRQAIQYNEARLALARQAGHRRGEGYALGSLGIAYAELGEAPRSIEYLEQALSIFRALGDRRSEGISLINLGNVYNELEQTQRSMEFFEAALNIFRVMGDSRGEAQALGSLALGYAASGEYRRSIEYLEQALVKSRELDDRRSEGAILGNLGLAYKNLGAFLQAVEFYEQQLAITRSIGDRRGEANALWNMSITLDEVGERAKAISYAESALDIYEQTEDRFAANVREQLVEWRTQK